MQDASAVITHAKPERESRPYRTEPVLRAGTALPPPESRNGLTNITLLMDRSPMLVGVAGFEENGFSADAANQASLRRFLGGACHSMILLADAESLNRQKANNRYAIGRPNQR